jgi:hypothetical protein
VNALVPQPESARPSLVAGGRPMAIVPQSMDEAYRLGKAICLAGMAPRDMDSAEKCMIAIMRGMEVGLTPMQAVDKIAIVNGRPTIWGDGAIGLVRGSGLCEYVTERIEGEGDGRIAVCTVKRRGETDPVTRKFSVADAKTARLWGKGGPWQQFPERMLQMRARAFALRDLFADVLGGLYLREEIEEDRPARGDSPPPAPRHISSEPPAAPRQIEHQPIQNTAQPVSRAPVQDAEVSSVGDPEPATSASATIDDSVVTMESLLTELDDRLSYAGTAIDIEEAYTDFDAEALLSDYPGGVEAGRKMKAQHLDRVAPANSPAAQPEPVDDFPGNEALAAMPPVAPTTRNPALARKVDPFAIPEFKGGGHYQIWVRAACEFATTPEHEAQLRLIWAQTKPQRSALAEEGQLDNVDVKGLIDAMGATFARIQAAARPADEVQDDLPPAAPKQASQVAQEPPPAPKASKPQPEPEKPASDDPVAAYTERLSRMIDGATTKDGLQKAWLGDADLRDETGASEAQRLQWKASMQQAKSGLPETEA